MKLAGTLIFQLHFVKFSHDKFEADGDPLEKTTTAEAIRTLTNFYRSSQYNYSARERVEEMIKLVSVRFSFI